MSPPWRRTPPLFLKCRVQPGAACSRHEVGGSLPRRGRLYVSWKGVLAFVLKGLLPVADEVVVEAERACGLGDGIALLGNEFDRLGLELRSVDTLRSCHCWTSQGDYTPLTGCPPFVGKSSLSGWSMSMPTRKLR